MVIMAVWITSAVYSIPKFIFVRTITNDLGDGNTETICVASRKLYNSKVFDMINFALLYVLPLLVMLILYSRIAITLWKSSRGLERHVTKQAGSSSQSHNGDSSYLNRKTSSKYEKKAAGAADSQVRVLAKGW
jgi:trissin receptor